ncbi:ABC transporter permease [Anatilimnocola floriformis]|uniref:ABC transporter permease n=1 Tax=Anatilimnocola floriformis TaxID=2948575 RepID=UPI0020C52CC1|nr:FtsX-like permease family protein [Anatilimnocola floriformis]
MSLGKFSSRSLTSRLGRTILTILSIVIGVTAVVSVSLLSETTSKAQKMMFETVTGKATLEVTVPGNAGFEDDIVAKVQQTPGVQYAVPLLQRDAKIISGEKQIKLQALGVDTARASKEQTVDQLVRDYKVTAGRMGELRTDKKKPYELVIDEGFAKQQHLKIGDVVSVRGAAAKVDLEVVGLAKPLGGAAMRQMALAMIPLNDSKKIFNRTHPNIIDSIQIVTAVGANVDQVAAEIAKILPEGLKVRPPSSNSNLMKRMLLSTEQSLFVSTVFSFVLACFIILNTFFMSVGERRRQLAIMRAVGATGKQIMYTMLGEALMLGVIGTGIGIPAGIGAAYLMNRTMSRGFDVILPDPQIHWLPIALAAFLGIGISLIGSYVPAWRAGQVSPLEGLSRVSREDIEGGGRRYLVFGGLLMLIGVVIVYFCIAGQLNIYVGPFGAVFLLIGVVFLSPLFLEPLITVFAAMIKPFTKVEGEMALRQILRHRVRTQLTIGVLFVAACAVIGMTISIKDNVRDMQEWYRASVTSDFFVRSLMPDMQKGTSPDLPAEVGDEIREISYLDPSMVERIVFVGADVLDKQGAEHGIHVVARDFADHRPPSFDLTDGTLEGLREKLFDGQVVIGSILAHDLNLKAGEEISILGRNGAEKVKVAAVANDYMVAGLSVHMQRKTAERILGIEGVDAYAIRLAENENREKLEDLRNKLAVITDKYALMLQSNTELSWTIDAMKAGVELGMWGLVYVAFFVAMIGVVNTLTMNVLEQTRELAMLRIVAMTKTQVRKTILTQALLISAAGLVPGIAVGVFVAYIMNLAMVPSFGREIEFHFYPGLLSVALFGTIAVTLIAAYFPARRAANVDLAQALHYD